MSRKYNKTFTSLKTVVHDTSILAAQKILVNVDKTNPSERTNLISYIDNAVNGALTEGLTFNTNTVNGTLDNATIKGIQYSKEHFITDAHITSITIPYNYQAAANSTGYLYIEIINEEGIVVNSAYSVGSGSFNDSSSGEHTVTFNFTDFYIPKNYKLVRLALVTNKTTVPNIVTTENCLSFRACPIKLNNNVNYDGDDCMIYASATSTQNWVIALTVTYNQIVGGVTDDILYNNIRAERLLKDVNNLTAASKTHISSEEAQNKFANKASTETAINKIGYTFEVANDATGEGESNAIHYAANKIPHNVVIDEVRIPVLNNSPKALYLAVWIVNQSGIKTYIGLSDEAVTWCEGGVAVWKFTNNPINVPDNYKLELFLTESAPSSGSTEIPTSSNYIKTYVNYSGSGTIRYSSDWYSGRDVRTTFVKNGVIVNHEDRITNLEENSANKEELAQLQSDVSELQSKNYAYTDVENVFSSANTFEAPIHTNNIIVDNGAIEFADDGEVTLSNGASGWPYTIFMPDKFENGKIYDLGLLTSDVDLSNVAFDGDDTIVQTAEIWFTLGDTVHNIIWPANVIWIDTIDGTMPPLTANLNYRLSIRKEVKYIVASISYTFKTPLI